jgi:hypothetical protein
MHLSRTSFRLGAALCIVLTTFAWHSDATAAQLTLRWADAASDEQGTSIERSVGAPTAFNELARTGPGVTTWADMSVQNGTTYCYRLRAQGFSDYSNAACGTALAALGLAVVRFGDGTGNVTSAPAGITCGASCSQTYTSGTTVTLTATPAAGSTFSGWSGGGCAGTGSCVVTVSAATTVTATFNVASTGGGSSSVFSDAFDRPNSTVLNSGWVEAQGDFSISNNKLWNSVSTARQIAIDPAVYLAAGALTAEFTSNHNGATPAFGLVFGYVNRLNYYAAYLQVATYSSLKIVRVVNGVEVVLAQSGIAGPVQGSPFALTARFSPSQVVLSVGGVNLTASGLSLPAGTIGFMVNGGGVAHTIDNFNAGS